jgi:hypothetical protein
MIGNHRRMMAVLIDLRPAFDHESCSVCWRTRPFLAPGPLGWALGRRRARRGDRAERQPRVKPASRRRPAPLRSPMVRGEGPCDELAPHGEARAAASLRWISPRG